MSIYKETAHLLIDCYDLSTRFINILAEERNMSNLIAMIEREMTALKNLKAKC